VNGLRKQLALALVAMALIAAGCGDDDDDDTSASTTTSADTTGATGVAETKEQWIATADEVCQNADEQLTNALEQAGVGQNPSDQEIRRLVETAVVPIQQAVVDTLRDLAPPEGEEEAVNGMLDALQESVDAIEADPSIALDEQAAEETFGEARQLAQDYGLEVCGS
jgi:hypothetical protein